MPLSKAKQAEWMREYRKRRYNVIPTTEISVIPKQSKMKELQQLIRQIETKPKHDSVVQLSSPSMQYPTYYPGGRKYPAGTMVRVKLAQGWQILPFPELDAEGNPI